ncbi:hypothetical protein D3C76_40990 [compost metagenome]
MSRFTSSFVKGSTSGGIRLIVLVIILILGLSLSLLESNVQAAAVEFTDSIQDQLNKTAAAADGAQKAKISKQYNDFSTQYKAVTSWDNKISSLHYENEAQVAAIRKEIKEINSVKIAKLEAQLQQTKSKYQPLFDSYSSLTRQVSTAKKLKDKTLYKILSAQADVLKTSAALARQDIRNKQDALTTAKKEKTDKARKIRSVLAEIDPIKNKIKSEKSMLSGQAKLISTEWTNFKSSIKKSDADRTSDTLSRLLALGSKANSLKQSIYNLELSISGIVKRSKAMLP